MASPIPVLIALAWLSLAGILMIDDVQRLWRRGSAPPAPAARRSRALGDYYALTLTFIVATICAPIVARLPSTWTFLAGRHPARLSHLELLAPIIAIWLCVCIAGRWALRFGLTTSGRRLWWVLLIVASVVLFHSSMSGVGWHWLSRAPEAGVNGKASTLPYGPQD